MKIEREHAESKETMAIGVAVDNKEAVKAHWVEQETAFTTKRILKGTEADHHLDNKRK